MDVTTSKVSALILFGIIKFCFGIAPLAIRGQLKRGNGGGRWIKRFIGGVLCTGGGLLLSTVFLHMLREVRESLEAATIQGHLPEDTHYPFPELLVCMGFLFILVVESIAHKFVDHKNKDKEVSKDDIEEDEGTSDTPPHMKVKLPRITGYSIQTNEGFDDECQTSTPLPSNGGLKPPPNVSPYFSNHKISGKEFNICSSTKLTSYNSATESVSIQNCKSPSKKEQAKDKRKMLVGLRNFLMIVAFSVHNLFEGMAVGLEESVSGVWQLFAAVIVHTVAIIFCIGTDMVVSGTKRWRMVAYMILVSAVTPAGVVLGIVLAHSASTHNLLIGVMQGLAAGTLLYITFFEVLEKERLSKYGMSGLIGVLIVILSFTLMAVVNSVAGHSHGHAGHGLNHGHSHQVEHLEQSHHEHHHDHDYPDISPKFGAIKTNRKSGDQYYGYRGKYDHFHEEYDINHGDHVHHIDAHSEQDDELFDYDHIDDEEDDHDHHHEHNHDFKKDEFERLNIKQSSDHDLHNDENQKEQNHEHNHGQDEDSHHNHDQELNHEYNHGQEHQEHNHGQEHDHEHNHGQEHDEEHNHVQEHDEEHNHGQEHNEEHNHGEEHDEDHNHGQEQGHEHIHGQEHNHENLHV